MGKNLEILDSQGCIDRLTTELWRSTKMKKLLSALALVALCSTIAMANVPCPEYCSITPLLGDPLFPSTQVGFLSPGVVNGTTLTITVRNCSNLPINAATVQVIFADAVKICTTAVHQATTSALGVCTITLNGGGCLSNVLGACVIKANFIEIRNLRNVRSPDNGSHTGSVPSGSVTTTDLGYFGDEFKGVAIPGCHDYDNNAAVNTTDLGYFGDAYKLGTVCTLAN
jgi:hypothetical protein